MTEFNNLEESMKYISDCMLESLTMLEILDELVDYSRKESTLISKIKHNISKSFNVIESSRNIISIPE